MGDPFCCSPFPSRHLTQYSVFQLSKVGECEVQWGAPHPTVLHTLEKGYKKPTASKRNLPAVVCSLLMTRLKLSLLQYVRCSIQ
jgi:hypothetical protein